MSLRDEYPCIRYRRKEDYSLESRKFASVTDFNAAGGSAAGWARSPKDVAREPVKPPAVEAPPAPAPAKRKPRKETA